MQQTFKTEFIKELFLRGLSKLWGKQLFALWFPAKFQSLISTALFVEFLLRLIVDNYLS